MMSEWMECLCCSDDAAKATEASLRLGARQLLTVAAERKTSKHKQTACSSDHTATDSQ